MAATCNWSEDPFSPDVPRDETRELNQPLPRPEEKTTAYWRKLHYEAAQRVSKMDNIRLKICPNIPTYNGTRGYTKARDAYFKIKRAEGLLLQAFGGLINYRTAHREWIFYLRRCNHGTNFYSPEQECYECNVVENELDQLYEHGWDQVKTSV
ncbi:MAG TPA: hypothetical protein VM715_09400 [Candidatus Acidoferrum sp.]|nr:hypothetical protein [Candidatus Acidoferrum sp.]